MSTLVAIAVLCAGWPGTASLAALGQVPASAGTWGNAREVPGLGQLNQGGNAVVASVSCPSVGNCGAGGWYSPASGTLEAFVVNEVKGRWRQPEEVPGVATLNTAGVGLVDNMSCPSPGDCSAVGTYQTNIKDQLPFVVTETNGTWGQAAEVPGLSALGTDKYINFGSVSCASPGNCSAGGSYGVAPQGFQAFVVSQAKGKWGKAEEVPGSAALNTGGNASTGWISCPAVGDCSADGQYTDASGHTQVFVVNESGGTWGTAQELPGLSALNANDAGVGPLSCGAVGDCGLGGTYIDSFGAGQVFVASESGGAWGGTEEIPGTASLNTSGANVTAISCPAAGDCGAVGIYGGASNVDDAFAVTESGGTWGNAAQIPGTGALNQGAIAYPAAISCPAPGDCGAGGYYDDSAGHLQVFVVNQSSGAWGTAEQIPGSAKLNTGGNAVLNAMSCPTVSHCTAGGFYTAKASAQEGFVVSGP
jgi:hypothetical protein